MMMGPLHSEMHFLSAIEHWLERSGMTDILVSAEINTPGRAVSFLSGKHVKRSRYLQQLPCAGLHLLCMDTYKKANPYFHSLNGGFR